MREVYLFMGQLSSSYEKCTHKISTVVALKHVRRMRGGAQSHLMHCSDRNLYVVKFQNNPQHIRVLANELIVTNLARLIGLPVPEGAVVEVSDCLIHNTPELHMEIFGKNIPCAAGLNFGSPYAINPLEGQVFDYLPSELLVRVRNPEMFAAMLALDKWVGNRDGRQAVFSRRLIDRKYDVSFIDHGHCFNVGDWNFPDKPLQGAYLKNEVYENVCGWDSFEPWLSRIETIEEHLVWAAVENTPPAWCGSDWRVLEQLTQTLWERRKIVRDLIIAFRDSQRRPFPCWGKKKTVGEGIPDLEPKTVPLSTKGHRRASSGNKLETA